MAIAENARSIAAKNVTVVPATGGHSGNLETQSNTVAERLAYRINADYYPLYLPESINDEMLQTMLTDSNISTVISLIKKTDIFLFGLSTIEQISQKRRLDEEMKIYLKERGAIAEAFGYYLDERGSEIYRSGSIGIKMSDYGKIDNVISIAGGSSKAKAIISINKNRSNNTLLIDEKAGEEMYNILGGK